VSPSPVIALVGNPNCGKTTLFNRLTGAHQSVGNWPGVTVERKTGTYMHAGLRHELVDLPGTFSLHVSHGEDSIDQQIAQNFILSGQPDLLLNIVDASSLERGLYLSTQLLDAGTPLVIALNMLDVANAQGVHIDAQRLAARLGCPVVPIVASRGEGMAALLDAINSQLKNRAAPASVMLDARFESALTGLQASLPPAQAGAHGRLVAAAILERDCAVLARLDEAGRSRALALVDTLEQQLGRGAADALIEERYRAIARLLEGALARDEDNRLDITALLDSILLNRWAAFPLFLGIMYLMFMFTINVGGAFTDFFNLAGAAVFVELPRSLMMGLGLPAWLIAAVADGLGGGVQLVASFIPVIATLFLFQSFLEDSGYMARAAFILDRLMRAMGLPGKSFVPLIVGFGCNVPAVMASRGLDAQQDRLLTTLMAPFMSCGARLTVYALFAAALFPRNGQNVVFALYLIGVVLAVFTGYLVRRALLRRDLSAFVMELPPYHLPTLRGLFIHTWHRLKGFVMRAGKAIVAVVVVLNFVNSLGTDGSFGNQNTERSLLSAIGKSITPVFAPLGLREENWPATVGIFSGVFAKEVVVGTLDALYSTMASGDTGPQAPQNAVSLLREAIASVGTNLGELSSNLADPLGMDMGNIGDREAAATAQDIHVGTLGQIGHLFDGQLGAFAYMLFVLLYMPCVATLGAIYKEQGGFWAFFSATWNTVIAWSLAVCVYQSGQIASAPASALGWILGSSALLGGCWMWLMRLARTRAREGNLIPVVNL
jgi:ferrous iron transport protein B